MGDLRSELKKAEWKNVEKVCRHFVRYRHTQPSPGRVWQVNFSSEAVKLSVVIPTSDADRGGYFPQLLTQISGQDFRHFELIVIRGDPRQGRAINIGAALAKGTYTLTLDDDTSLPEPKTFHQLVAVMDASPDIGLAGGNNVVPQQASSFVQRVMRQIPRRSWDPVNTITDSDLVEHPCMIMRTSEFKAVGGENELLPRGLDPYLRQAFREFGKRTVVVPDVLYHHLPPDTWEALVRQFFRNGSQAAWVNRHYPEWVIQTPSRHGTFVEILPIWKRMVRYPRDLTVSLLKGQWIWFTCQLSYASGFILGLLAESRPGFLHRKHR
ncbi:MAG: hypothetical protein NPIRA05_04510 [Nitrospirales bacterium]|nr:MAG: hypothetical protein NPIRA05_04510 [Nitrospirales bacterium]